MARLVVSNRPALLLILWHRLLDTRDDSLRRQLEVSDCDGVLVSSGGHDCCLVANVLNVSAGEARCERGQLASVNILLELRVNRDLLEVDHEYLGSFFERRQVDLNWSVESAGPEQRLVEDVGPVGCRQHNDRGVSGETIHLHEQLVERVVPLVVASAHLSMPRFSDRVDFVDEDNRWSLLPRLLEEVPHSGGADADEHLHKVRARDGKEGYL